MGMMERGEENDMRHPERGKQRCEGDTVADLTKAVRNSNKLAPSFFSVHFE